VKKSPQPAAAKHSPFGKGGLSWDTGRPGEDDGVIRDTMRADVRLSKIRKTTAGRLRDRCRCAAAPFWLRGNCFTASGVQLLNGNSQGLQEALQRLHAG